MIGRIATVVVIFWVTVALIGPLLAPHDPGAILSYDVFSYPDERYWLGSDYLGRDVLSRVLGGARYTVGLALAAALIASSSGVALALLAAVSGRAPDETISRFMDALISIPSKIFALVMVAAFESSIPVLLAIAGLIYMPGAYRIARALAVSVDRTDYVEAARARGEGRLYLTCVEILPNMIRPVLTDFGLRFVFIVLLLSGLSFLGLGVQPPHADLGSLVRENISGIGDGAPAVIIPALAIASLTIAVNLMIDALPGRIGRPAGESS